MALELLVDKSTGAFLSMIAMMAYPGFPQHLLSESSRPLFVLPIVHGIRALLVAAIGESVCAGAQGDNWFAGFQIIHKVLHLRVRQFPESKRHDTQISRIKRLHSWNVCLRDRINDAFLGVDRK